MLAKPTERKFSSKANSVSATIDFRGALAQIQVRLPRGLSSNALFPTPH
jgi:hypothetical protein